MSDSVDERAALLAERLNFLFAHIHPRGGAPQSNEAVGLATGLSTAEIADLRAGVPLDRPPGTCPFVSRLEHLLRTRVTESGSPYLLGDVAKSCGKSRVWLYNLLAGKSKPTLESTMAICRMFQVDPSFFTDDPSQALARHFGVAAGAPFFSLPPDDVRVRDTKASVELLVELREAGVPAVIGRYLGSLPRPTP
ncbi:hypothetical protein ACIQWR_26030 [Streptomyces sp. NPDC098789]|uniref:hypothetical protein n=1 Tax=Streptomyces sp. NPDC098789 TaxID=3366098 RepID=UPI00381F2474